MFNYFFQKKLTENSNKIEAKFSHTLMSIFQVWLNYISSMAKLSFKGLL